MKINETIGIDISKKTFDVFIHTRQLSEVFENTQKGFVAMYAWYRANCNFPEKEVLIAFEHTGLYSEGLSDFLLKKGALFTMISGLEIKRSLGMTRGKSDSKDAMCIAKYAFRRREELEPSQLPSKNIRSLRKLLSLRERVVKQRAGYKASVKEQKRVLKHKEDKILIQTQQQIIKGLNIHILNIEKELGLIISSDRTLDKIYRLITSIKGVGKQTALFLIAYTDGFTKFKNVRKFASYCGTAPFPNQSGTSMRGKTKVSHLANKKIKSLLDMCAKSAIQSSSEMKTYYQRRVEMGKNKMSTINIIRNKLLARIFAVVNRGTPYVDTMKFAA